MRLAGSRTVATLLLQQATANMLVNLSAIRCRYASGDRLIVDIFTPQCTSIYQRLVIKLINSNYHYVRITAETLEEAAKQSAWKPDRQFEKVAGILSGGNSDDFSAVTVASHFIFKLYTQQLFLAD